jgi:hypothetical protein
LSVIRSTQADNFDALLFTDLYVFLFDCSMITSAMFFLNASAMLDFIPNYLNLFFGAVDSFINVLAQVSNLVINSSVRSVISCSSTVTSSQSSL